MPDRYVDALFARLLAMYGDKWLTLWLNVDLDAVKRVWGEELAGVSPDSIRQAIDALDSPFPPTLPEFRALCRSFRLRDQKNVSELLALPGVRRGPETFRQLRDILDGVAKREKPVEE